MANNSKIWNIRRGMNVFKKIDSNNWNHLYEKQKRLAT